MGGKSRSDLREHKELEDLYRRAKLDIINATLENLEEIRVKYLGRKSRLTTILRSLGELPPQERARIGRLANSIRQALEEEIRKKQAEEEKKYLERKFEEEKIDITLPGRRFLIGKKHIITQIIDEITQIFIGLGYQVAEGPEIETDYYNFTALNTPPDHPARTLQATLYVETSSQKSEEILLRTHTSPVQIRVMKESKPPIYIIASGKTYRRDVADPTHSPMFHQIEGLAVDRDITFGDLKGTLEVFIRQIFGADRAVRFRPHYFPFTEPSAEVDVSCLACDGKGCRVCSYRGWLEILGAGMVDPNVLREVGYDPEEVNGFAFGMGVERIAMLKYGINDIRLFFENDVRFLRQF